MDKKRLIIAIMVFLVLTGAFWGIYKFYFKDGDYRLEASGTIEATTVEVKARVSATLEKCFFDEGDTVEKGKLMAELSRSDLEAQKARDEMAVKAAEANLSDLLTGARAQEVMQAMLNVDMARVNLDKAKSDLEKLNELFEAGAVSKEAVEKAYTDMVLKEKQLEAAQAQLSLIKEGSRSGQIAAAVAELERSKAVLRASEAALSDLKLNAPISGTVLSRNFTEGEFVTMGASVYTLADLDDLWVKVYIPTDDLPKVKLGQKVKCTVSGSSKVYSGKVIKIADRGEFTPKTIQTKKERANVVFAVKIAIENNDKSLKPGMPVDVVFETGR
ncbi:efflux RND transporter periplasmic adaptor subunit [Thermosyntropha sp.]|uniref:HlyD family secretion protein n=1 Tax=Thermosyntropha sp. TaxID=2740820 RepID=UPI0025E17C07|nr:efflux RND transporter periplasmic adaptor subunit [Thermosyntropha sp.]MBO8158738.1 efflux RND transporter periplasmic adaptor subunit [Thermosyntropha sp.]